MFNNTNLKHTHTAFLITWRFTAAFFSEPTSFCSPLSSHFQLLAQNITKCFLYLALHNSYCLVQCISMATLPVKSSTGSIYSIYPYLNMCERPVVSPESAWHLAHYANGHSDVTSPVILSRVVNAHTTCTPCFKFQEEAISGCRGYVSAVSLL